MNKYIWLISFFSRAGDKGRLLDEVCSAWRNRWNEEYSRRSFCNHREAIREVFGIDIACDRSTNRYFIKGSNPLDDPAGEKAWLINSFTVNNLLSLGRGKLAGRVSVESVPSGQRWLTSVMEAMEDGTEVEITYRKYTGDEDERLHVRPYGLKEHEKRWYLAGYCTERGRMRVYGLDRIMSMTQTGVRFELPADFNIEDLFAGSYGIYLPEGRKTEKVVLKATEREARYLRDLPLHRSQKEISPGVFSLRVIPDLSLVLDLCKRGDRVEVLEPEHLRKEVEDEHGRALSLYVKQL